MHGAPKKAKVTSDAFDFKDRNFLSGPHLLGVLLLFSGVLACISPAFLQSGSYLEKTLIVGISAIIIGLSIVTTYSGVSIDLARKTFKEYTSFCGYKIGKRATLPGITKIKLIARRLKGTNTSNGVSPTLSGKFTVFMVFVYSSDPKPFLTFEYQNKKKAIRQAQVLATGLKTDLVQDFKEE